jgi:hypothetical protein
MGPWNCVLKNVRRLRRMVPFSGGQRVFDIRNGVVR